MSLPPLQLRPISTSHYYTSGDVTIQDGAAIAPGVLLQADPDSRIVIKSGACVGIGTILHAHQGLLEIGEGANIGAEALLIGQVTIGAHACIGAASTILNQAIAPNQIVPPGSLIGDHSRPVAELQATDTVILPPPPSNHPEAAVPTEPTTASSGAIERSRSNDRNEVNVYGQVYVNQLLVKMFPNSQRSPNAAPPPLNQSNPPADPWDD